MHSLNAALRADMGLGNSEPLNRVSWKGPPTTCCPVPCSKQHQPGLLTSTMPDTSNQHKKTVKSWCQCHQSVKTRACRSSPNAQLHAYWTVALKALDADDYHWGHALVCNISVLQLHPPDSSMLSQLPIRTEAAVTFFQQHSLFPYPSGPEFCPVPLSSGRKRHYFRMLSGGHALVIHQNCNPITTVRVFPCQCPMGVMIKLHQSTSQTLPASHG